MFRKLSVSEEPLTPEVAAKFSAMTPLPGERELKHVRIRYLTNLIPAAKFIGPQWAVAVDKSTGQQYRANGQHSSFVLSHLPPEIPFPAGLKAFVEHFELDTLHDAHDLFDLFDPPFSSRSNTDYMGMVKQDYPELRELDSALLVALANGIDMWHATRPQGAHIPARYRGDRLFEDEANRRFVVWAAKFRTEEVEVAEINNATARVQHPEFLAKVGVVTELYDGYRTNPAAADRFWCLTFTEAHPDPEHESRELARVLQEMLSKPHAKTDQYRTKVARFWKRYLRMSDEVSGQKGTGSMFAAEETAEEASINA